MRNHLLRSTMVLAVMWAVWWLAPNPATGQGPAGGAPMQFGGCPAKPADFHTCAVEKAKTFTPPRAPDGRPDFQGYWRGRPGSAGYSIEAIPEDDPLANHPLTRWTPGPTQIVDPPDGKIPYQPWAAKIGRRGGVNFEKYIDPRTACGPAGIPRNQEGLGQILQPTGGDTVMWIFEDQAGTNYRTIAIDGRPHVGDSIKTPNGNSIGRFEGNSFVIDTTNLSANIWLDDAANFYTDAAHLVERLTMIDQNTIHYQVTLEDPKAYTRPWTMAWPLTREVQPGFELLEVACREGERVLPYFVTIYQYYTGNKGVTPPR